MFTVVGRAWQLFRSAFNHLFVPWALRRATPPRAERMQAVLEEVGGLWVKLGQALALRFDILPADYCLQLFRLLNQMKPFSTRDARSIIEHELGRPVDALFRSFDWQPHAAASIGQVHRAELPDGTPVVVKVQRPGIREQIRVDLRLMRGLAALIDLTPVFGHTRARALIQEFARWTEEELDYRIEARHAAVLRRNAEGDPLERNPRVHPEYTTARVLTLEYLDGTPIIEIVTAIRRRDAAFLDSLAARGHDTRRLAGNIVWNALNQIYRFGYFHADPHPANLIALPGDAIGYVDFGIVGKLDDRTTEALRHFAQSLFAGHTGVAVDEFMRFLTPSARTDLRAARRDLIEAMNNYIESARVGPEGFRLTEDIFEIEMLAVVRSHDMALDPDAVRYLKAVLTAEAMVKELDPRFDLRSYENRFFGRLMELEAVEAVDPRRVGQWILDARRRFERVLDAIEIIRETPRDLVGVAFNVRRRVQLLSALTIIGWVAMLVAVSATGSAGLRYPATVIAFGVALISLALLAFSILEVRRLPSESEAGRLSQYPAACRNRRSESDAAPWRRLVKLVFERSSRPYKIGPNDQGRARHRGEGALCGEVRLTQQSIGRVAEVGLHRPGAQQSLPHSACLTSNPAPFLVLGRTLEPRLTPPPLLLRPGVDLFLGGRRRFRNLGKIATCGAARPVTLFLFGRPCEPGLAALVLALRPLRHFVL